MKLNSPMSLTECCEGAMAFTRRSLAQATANKEKTFQYLFVEGLIGSDEYVCFDEHPSEECWTGWANTNMEIDGRHPIKMLIRSFEIPQKKKNQKAAVAAVS